MCCDFTCLYQLRSYNKSKHAWLNNDNSSNKSASEPQTWSFRCWSLRKLTAFIMITLCCVISISCSWEDNCCGMWPQFIFYVAIGRRPLSASRSFCTHYYCIQNMPLTIELIDPNHRCSTSLIVLPIFYSFIVVLFNYSTVLVSKWCALVSKSISTSFVLSIACKALWITFWIIWKVQQKNTVWLMCNLKYLTGEAFTASTV